MNHLIQRQILELIIPDQQQAFDLQREASDIFQRKVLPQLALVFDRLAPDDRWISIDQLELDIGTIHLDNWEQELPAKIAQQVEHWLQEQQKDASKETDKSFHIQSKEQHSLEQFAHFIEHGYLAVQVRQASFSMWEAQIVESLAKTGNRKVLPQLLSLFKQENCRQRLFRQFSISCQQKLIECLKPETDDRIRLFRQWVSTQSWPLQPLWEAQLREANVDAKHIIQTAIEVYVKKSLVKHKQITSAFISLENKTEKTSLEVLAIVQDKLQLLDQKFEAQRPTSSPSNSESLKKSNSSLQKNEALIREGIYVENAGLVLISPFIPRLFENLSLAKHGELHKPDRAIYLLQYLLNGAEEMPEYDLVLNKLLCGFPLEESPEGGFVANEQEVYEVEDLLTSLIEHWGALKSSSSDGLREAFLRREGKLIEEAENWTLIVAQKDYDLLLDKIPWSYSVVKLPWMDKRMLVEWV